MDEVLIVINATAVDCEGEDKGRVIRHFITPSTVLPKCSLWLAAKCSAKGRRSGPLRAYNWMDKAGQ